MLTDYMGSDTMLDIFSGQKYANHPQQRNFKATTNNALFRVVDIVDIEIASILAHDMMELHYNAMNGMFLFLLPLIGNINVTRHDESYTCLADRHCALLCGPNSAGITVPEYSNLILMIGKKSDLFEILRRNSGGNDFPPLAFDNPISQEIQGTSFFYSLMEHVITAFAKNPGMAQSPLLSGQYKSTIMTAILTCLPHNCAHLFRPCANRRTVPRIVRLAEEFMRKNSDRPLQLSDLMRITGRSARSIQAMFKRSRGYTPSEFLRQCRLNRARSMLQAPRKSMTVLSVALACGFASQSHFSKCYRREFGERALDTLQRGP